MAPPPQPARSSRISASARLKRAAATAGRCETEPLPRGKGRQLHQLTVVLQPRAHEPGVVEAEGPPHPRTGPLDPNRLQNVVEKARGRRRARHRLGSAQRVERVPLGQRAEQGGEDLGTADQVERHGYPGHAGHGAGLTLDVVNRSAELAEILPAAVEEIAHRGARGRDVVIGQALGHAGPHLALVGGAIALDRLALAPPQHRVGGLRARPHRLPVAPVIPAPLLDTAHLELEPRAGGHEHGAVEEPVLLGAEHLLALVDEKGKVGGVLHEQPADSGARLQLRDPSTELDRV